MIDRVRLRDACPLPNRLDGDHLALSWHRALDRAVALGAGRSLRGGDRRTFYVHPPNARKRDAEQWLEVLDRIEHGMVPRIQMGQVDWTGNLAEWMGPARREPFRKRLFDAVPDEALLLLHIRQHQRDRRVEWPQRADWTNLGEGHQT